MSTHDTPHPIGHTFHLPLDELVIDVGENMREVHDPGLRELAESMSSAQDTTPHSKSPNRSWQPRHTSA